MDPKIFFGKIRSPLDYSVVGFKASVRKLKLMEALWDELPVLKSLVRKADPGKASKECL
jgi:hypothetical protein